MLYAFGSNSYGQLGINGRDDMSSPQPCILSTADLFPYRPCQIAAGGNHTLILTESGHLYCAGLNTDGRAGSTCSKATIEKTGFHEVDLGFSGAGIKLCSASWESSVFVTLQDEVYTSGLGPYGELGNGCTRSLEPQKLLNFPPPGTGIVDLSSGINHVVVILSNGEVYGWGNGRKGQLGKPAGFVKVPRKVESIGFKVVHAVCGREFTYLASDSQAGNHALLGADKWNIKSSAPTDIVGWKDIWASWGSILVLKRSGKVESWGRNDRGQLAPKNLPAIDQLAVGSEHVVALTISGQVVTWGWGEHGNCGQNVDPVGDVKNRWNEIVIDSKLSDAKVEGVAAGCATSFVWTRNLPPNKENPYTAPALQFDKLEHRADCVA